MPIMDAQTRIGPILKAKEWAVARAAAANPTYRDPTNRCTEVVMIAGTSALSGVPMGLPSTAGRQVAMKGTKSGKVIERLFRLRALPTRTARCLIRA